MSQLNWSARAYHRILKLARTSADLVGREEIQSLYLADALHAPQSPKVDDGLIRRTWDFNSNTRPQLRTIVSRLS